MKRSIILLLCLFLCAGTFGCRSESETTIPAPQEHTLQAQMHCTVFGNSGDILRTYDAALSAVVRDALHEEDTIDISLDATSIFGCTFDHDSVQFTITQEEQGLPYYCAYGALYDPVLDSTIPYVLAIDFEMQYFILKPNGNVDQCVVASVDPNVDPKEIHAHFARFLELFYYPDA